MRRWCTLLQHLASQSSATRFYTAGTAGAHLQSKKAWAKFMQCILEGSASDVWSACLLVDFSLRKPDDRFLMAFSSFQWWVACQTHIFDHVLSTSCNSLRSPLTGYVHFMHYTNMVYHLPSGNLTYSYWKWPFIVDFPIKTGDFP